MKEGFYSDTAQRQGSGCLLHPRRNSRTETGQTIIGVWHLTHDICHNGEAEILAGPPEPPNSNTYSI